MTQYVEIGDAPDARHIVKHVNKGKGKNGSKTALTVCGKPFAVDDAIVFAQPTSQIMNQPAAKPCGGCNGLDEAPAVAAAPMRYEEIDVDAIERSPLNHRQRFDGIEELGADIKANGLRVPIKVRPHPKPHGKIKWQLVYGERRWRGAKAAGVAKLPALIVELDDLAVIKEQLVENVSRSDVHPMEEAEGYHALLEQHGYTAEQISKETGKSRTAVYNRLKLLDLPKSARVAFLGGRLVTSVAEMIARIPVEALREEATRDVLRGKRESKWDLDQVLEELDERSINHVDDEDGDGEAYADRISPREGLRLEEEIARDGEPYVPLSVREAEALIKRRYMLRLELAPFDLANESLPGGACTLCVHRTGNQRDLFGDVASADVCTNPPCYEEKRAVSTAQKIAATKAAGLEVLDEKKAEKLFNSSGGLTYSSPYVDLDAPADDRFQEEPDDDEDEDDDEDAPPPRERTWREVLNQHAEEVPRPTVALDDRGTAHELVDKKLAMKLLGEAAAAPKSGSAARDDYKKREAKEREERAVKLETASRAIAEIAACAIDSTKIALWLAESAIRQASMEAHTATVKRRAIGGVGGSGYGRQVNENALLKYARAMKTQGELEGLVLELLAWESAVVSYGGGWGRNLEAGAKVFHLDLKKIKSRVVAERKEATKRKAKPAAKPEPAKKPAKKKGKKS